MREVEYATLSAVIDARVKLAATQHCRRYGLTFQKFVERAIAKQLEDTAPLDSLAVPSS